METFDGRSQGDPGAAPVRVLWEYRQDRGRVATALLYQGAAGFELSVDFAGSARLTEHSRNGTAPLLARANALRRALEAKGWARQEPNAPHS